MAVVLFVVSLLLSVYARDDTVFITELGNSCPKGTAKLTTVVECRAGSRLAGTNGDDYNGEEYRSDWPSGCYHCNNTKGCIDGSWFNTHPIGAANHNARPYCSDGFVPIQKGQMLMVGDSDIDYWIEWSTVFGNANNIGFGGYTCRNVNDEAQLFIEAFEPSAVVLVCGENDLAYGYNVESKFKSFSKVVGQYLLGGSRVIYIGTKPEPSTTGLHHEYKKYDQLIANLAANMSGTGVPPLTMIDSYGAFEEIGNPKSLYRSDGLHLSDAGYKYWDQWVDAVLNAKENNTNCYLWKSGACAENVGAVTTGNY